MKANEFIFEKWNQKYKSSINCSHPKGFSQKAHCAGKKKHNESIENVMEMTCPDCGMCETHGDHENLDEACWKGYHKEGNKKMFGKTYPNCVKNKKTNEDVMGSLNELSVDLLQKAAQVAKDKREQAMNPEVHNALGGGYMNPLAKHYDTVNQKLNNRAVKVGIRDKVSKIASPALMRKMELEGIEEDNSRIARKPGQPAGSKKHSDLYTDENPKGTITGLKFATAEDARASVSKIRNSGRSHAHKIQAAVAMEQRARAAGKAEAAAVYRQYINATKKTESQEQLETIAEDLRKWFKQKWVRFGPDGKIRGDCARGSEKEGKPKCLPQAKAHALGKKGRASAASRKRRQDPNANRSGAAINVSTKGKKK